MSQTALAASVAIVLCVSGSVGHAAQAPVPGVLASPQVSDVRPPSVAQVRGRVLDAANGTPVRNALVTIVSPTLREAHTSATDAQGRYEFTGLAASRYRLVVEKEGYVSLEYGQTRPFAMGKPLELRGLETLERVDFNLPRGGVITGRVVDESGDPAPNVNVRALRYVTTGDRRGLTEEASDTTDDLGEYRLYGLMPARYQVSAVPRRESLDADGSSNGDSGDEYAPTYYPGTANAAEGHPLTVALQRSIADVNFGLVPARLARLSGTAVNPNGRPLIGIVRAFHTDVTFGDQIRAQIQPDGTFTLGGVPPGEYQLRADGQGSVEDGWELATARVSVTGRDIANISLAATAPTVVSGRIILESSAAKSVAPSAFRLVLSTIPIGASSISFGSGQPVRVREDWTFALKAAPGIYDLQHTTMPAGWSLKAVRLNGLDITDNGVDVKPNQDVRDIEIELTNHPANVSGTVVNDLGELVKDYTVIVFSRDEQRWKPRSRYVLASPPDQDGRFAVNAPPPGDYLAVALGDVEPDAWTDPEFLRTVRNAATPFSLGEGETRELRLKLR